MQSQPPNDSLSEQALLGCLFITDDQGASAAMLGDPGWPRTSEWYDLRHRRIADVCGELVAQGQPIGLATVCSKLGAGGIASVGGVEYLSSLSDKATTASNWRFYAEPVRKKAQARAVIQQCREAIKAAMEDKDPAELASKLSVELGDISQSNLASGPVPMKEVMARTIGFIEDRVSGKNMVPTGFPDLDKEMKGGMGPGEYVLIAARTSVGKTALAVNVAVNVAKWLKDRQDDRNVLICSFEMSVESVGERMLNSEAEFDVGKSAISPSEQEHRRTVVSYNRLESLPIMVDDRTSLTAKQIVALARAEHSKKKLALVVIDYVQLIEAEQGGDQNRVVELGKISRTIKNGFKDLKVPVLLVAQLNRKAEDRDTPKKSDLRECGDLEQDAQFIGLLYERKDNKQGDRFKRIAMRIDKNRRGQTGIDIGFVYEGSIYKFRSESKINKEDM